MKELIKKWYNWGLWSADMVAVAVAKKIITQTDADYILGGAK